MACVSASSAQTPPGLGDLVGARGSSGESELQRRGYAKFGGQQSDDRSYTYWWNAQSRQCVTVATMDGRCAYHAIARARLRQAAGPPCGQAG